MIDFGQTYSATWRLRKMNIETWVPTDVYDGGVKSLSFKTSGSGTVPLLQQGSMVIEQRSGEAFEPGWYQVEMIATAPSGETSLVPVMVLNFESSSGVHNKGFEEIQASGTSVLGPVDCAVMRVGEFINKGADGAAWVGNIIRTHTPAPVVVDGSFKIDSYYVWDAGTSYLEAAWKILDAAKWVLSISPRGVITVHAKPDTPDWVLDRNAESMLMPGISYDKDYTSVYNRYIAVEGSDMVVVTNDDPDSVVSTVRRGYVKECYDEDVIRVDGETLRQYAERQLEDISTFSETYTYKREYVEGIGPFSRIAGNIKDVFRDDLSVASQSYDCSHGILIEEEVALEVKLWQPS